MKQYNFKVTFDEIDTVNFPECFIVTANDLDQAWEIAKNEARIRGLRHGHNHEFALEQTKHSTEGIGVQ